MKRLSEILCRRPVFFLVLAALLVGGLSPGLLRLREDNTVNGLINASDPGKIYYDEVKDLFGDDSMLVVVFHNEDLFTPQTLRAVHDLTYAAEDIDGVSRVSSLFTVNRLVGVDGFLDTEPLFVEPPTEEEIEETKPVALDDAVIRSSILSEDGNSCSVNIFLETREEDPKFHHKVVSRVAELIAEAEATAEEGTQIYQIGAPVITVEFSNMIMKDFALLIPASIAVIFLVLYLIFQSSTAVVIPVVTGGLSVAGTYGVMGFLGFTINPISSIIPVLLFVVGCTEDIHLIEEYAHELKSKAKKQAAIRNMTLKCGLAITLTSLTTLLGFATIMGNSVPLLKEFGILSTIGIFLNYVLTLTLVPALLRFLPARKLREANAFRTGVEHYVGKLEDWVLGIIGSKAGFLRAAFGIGFVLLLIGCARVVVNSDWISYFHQDAPIRSRFADIEERLAGGYTFYVVVDTHKEEGVRDAGTMKAIAKLHEFLEARFDKVTSIAELMWTIHREMGEGEGEEGEEVSESEESEVGDRVLPEDSDLISQYVLLLNQDDVDLLVDFDFRQSCLLVRTGDGSSRAIHEDIEAIKAFVAKELPGSLSVEVSGEVVLVAQVADRIAKEIVWSVTILLALIVVIIMVLFMSFKAGFLALLPNLFPVVFNFGLMGWFGIPLSIGTFSVAVIALGIAVDDTVHFMVRYFKAIKSDPDNTKAMETTIRSELAPVLSTSLALSIGFGVLCFSEFGMISNFGFLASLTIVSALVSDVFLTPLMLLNGSLISAWDFISLKLRADALDKSRILAGLTPSEIKRFILLGQSLTARAGNRFVNEGDHGEDMFFILKGEVEVLKRSGSAGETVISTLKQGEVFGEMALVSGAKRTASVVASRDTEVIVMSRSTLDRVRRRDPKIAAKVFENISAILSQRLTKMNEVVLE